MNLFSFLVRVKHRHHHSEVAGNSMVILLATVYLMLAVANASCPQVRQGVGSLSPLLANWTCPPPS